ncbi:hypothetical protein M422DRAFT_257489 [Sphaerobolus stellatus SS14]|uniref:Uncharacterized protein n=1 Tax=Sphaerobolus stellatus (strain SS14) TaxID=990650 RepID=A0A0C9VNL2_SPHS4|nr:hypothetical protein M422DRAFT_257489 [Sphaerobolus stellatus SS14]
MLPLNEAGDIFGFNGETLKAPPSTLIQDNLKDLKEEFNAHCIHYDAKKALPSGISPDEAMASYETLDTKY